MGKGKADKGPKQLGPATVVKPVVIGALALTVVNTVLGFVLGG